MSWPEVENAIEKNSFALLPIGCIEGHGPHLPLRTDLIIAEYLGQRVAEETGGLLLPALLYSQTWSLKDYPGTVSIDTETLAQTIKEIVQSLERHGVTRVFVLNCHAGNLEAIKAVERELQREGKVRTVNLTLPGMEEAIHRFCETPRWHSFYIHAEEMETSIMLAIAPDVVDMGKAVKEYPAKPVYFGPVSISWREMTHSGVIGDATVATAGKGQQIMDMIVARTVAFINSYNRKHPPNGIGKNLSPSYRPELAAVPEEFGTNQTQRRGSLISRYTHHDLSLMSWPEVETAINETGFAILPLGVIEAHGPHLPMNVDVVIAEQVAKLVADKTGALLLPALPYGQTWSLRDFPGTISLSNATLVKILLDVANSLAYHGLRRLFIMNGHLGNLDAIKAAEREAQKEGYTRIINLNMPGLPEAMQKVCTTRRAHPFYFHAEEAETSMMLAIRPDLVKMPKAVAEYPEFPAEFGAVSISWRDLTRSGVLGDPTVATAEKGRLLIDMVATQAAAIVQAYNHDHPIGAEQFVKPVQWPS